MHKGLVALSLLVIAGIYPFAGATRSIAQDNMGLFSDEKAVPPQVPATEDGTVKPMVTNCYTNQVDCAGYATSGGFGYDVGCSIWWNNGANGRTNFTLKAGETHEWYVRYNDTAACIGIQYAPPKDSPRFYIYVHN